MRRSKSVLGLGLVVVVASSLVYPLLAQESRRFRRIPVPEKATPASKSVLRADQLPPLPTREDVEAMVYRLAQSYGTEDLGDLLAEDFPYKSELLDVLRRARMRISELRLDVEAIERVEIGPWQEVPCEEDGAVLLHSTCLADVRTRLSYDELATGKRVVRDPGRGEWQLRFSEKVVVAAVEEVAP